MEASIIENTEKCLRNLDRNRETFETSMLRIRDDLMQIIAKLFESIGSEMNEFLRNSDDILDPCTAELRRLEERRNELDTLRQKLIPVLDILQRGL